MQERMRNHPTALTRQIEESVAIEKKKVHVLMNSKGEWNSQRIPRIVVKVQGRDEEEEGELSLIHISEPTRPY